MPAGKPNVRRVKAVSRRGGRKGGRGDDDDEKLSAPAGFSQRAFLGVTIIGVFGFLMVLCQLYRAVNSEQGLEVGSIRLRLRGKNAGSGIPTLVPLLPGEGVPFPQSSGFSSADLGMEQKRLDEALSSAKEASVNLDPLPPVAVVHEERTQPPPPPAPAHQPDPEPHCKWREHAGRFLGELAVAGVPEGSENQARVQCVTAGSVCAGVTCNRERTMCSPRRGDPYLSVSPTDEISFTKDCGGGTQGNLPQAEAVTPAPAPAFVERPAAASSFQFQDTLNKIPMGFLPTELDTSQFQLRPPGQRQPLGGGKAVLVVIAHNRPDCLERCLRNIVGQSDAYIFKLAVSLDDPGSFPQMEAVIAKFQGSQQIDVWRKPMVPLRTAVQKIGAHFQFALTQAFDVNKFEYAIFLENDLELAPDALWYFRSTAWLLEEDPSLFCVSAWNDNGFKGLVSNERRLFRTDYFPGLGWMTRSETWDKHLRGIWPSNPTTGWDHWLRHGSGLRPRECIVPEVSRTHHFDEKGTNVKKGNAISKLLAKMAQSQLPAGELSDLSYLLKDQYDNQLRELLQSAQTITSQSLDNLDGQQTYMLPYTREDYKNLAKRLEIYVAQIRTAHRGMVITRHPQSKATIIMVDRRQADGILPEADQWRPNAQLRVGAAGKGQSCDSFCLSHSMRCEPEQLEYINRCSVLKEHFPCEKGCGHQVGLEIPCYVHDSKLETALQCLVTDDVLPTCKAGHRSTTRLCACSP